MAKAKGRVRTRIATGSANRPSAAQARPSNRIVARRGRAAVPWASIAGRPVISRNVRNRRAATSTNRIIAACTRLPRRADQSVSSVRRCWRMATASVRATQVARATTSDMAPDQMPPRMIPNTTGAGQIARSAASRGGSKDCDGGAAWGSCRVHHESTAIIPARDRAAGSSAARNTAATGVPDSSAHRISSIDGASSAPSVLPIATEAPASRGS